MDNNISKELQQKHRNWFNSTAGQTVLTLLICIAICSVIYICFKFDSPSYVITVPNDWTYVADDLHGHYIKTKTIETTVVKEVISTHRRNRHNRLCTKYVMADNLPYFDELSSVTQKTNVLNNYEIDNGTKIKTGDRIRITTTAYLDILDDSKPGTAFYTNSETSVEVLEKGEK